MKKLIFGILLAIFALAPIAQATTTNSSVNLAIANNSDGWQAGGGTTSRLFTITGSAWTLGNNTMQTSTGTFTLPASTDQLVGRASTDTLTNKTIAQSEITSLVASGKTFTANNSITIAGTDATTMTFPATTGTVDVLNNAQTFTAVKTFTNSDLAELGSSTGATTITSDNSGASNFTMHLPAANDTLADLAGAQSFTNKTLTSSTNVFGGVTMTLGSDGTADVYYRNSSGILTRLGNPGANELLGYDSTDAIPAYIVLGSGLTYTHSTHTLSSSAGYAPMPTTLVAASTQSMTTNNAYYANDGSTLVTFTLPSTSSVGDEVIVGGYSSGGWKLAQNASGQIIFGSNSTTTGTSGYVSSNNQYDEVYLKCVVANNIWAVISSQGNITIN